MFNRSERKLVSTLDEMRSLWQEFVRRKDTDTTVSTVYTYIYDNLHGTVMCVYALNNKHFNLC